MRIVMVEPFGSFEPGTTVEMDREAAVALMRRGIARPWSPDTEGTAVERHPDKSMKPRRTRKKG